MKTYAYIIKNDTLIAVVETELENGSLVKFSSQKCKESMNANRNFNLVNAQEGKISRDKKWEIASFFADSASEINEAEFLIH